MERKDYLHNPTHIFIDNSPYFITGAIYKKQPLLRSTEIKQKLLNCIISEFERHQWELHHWVILDNHYHLLGKSKNGKNLSKIIQQIHSITGYHIKKITQTSQQPIWWNYWDYCPRNEEDYLTHLNYLFNNPIKHGYISNLNDYPFSSFHQMIEKQGREILAMQFRNYADYKKLQLDEDDF